MRMSLGGGGTDLPSYSSKHGGMVITTAIDKYVFVVVHRRLYDDEIRVTYSQAEFIDSVDGIENDLVRESLKRVGETKGIDVSSFTDIPYHTGMGGSGAFGVGFIECAVFVEWSGRRSSSFGE